jgi:PEP-CTERM motif
MRLRFSFLLIFSLVFALHAHADTVTYTETATVTGSLGGTPFTNATVTLSGTGETANITSIFTNIYDLLLPVSVQVSGIPGTYTFTDFVQVAANQNVSGAGFGDVSVDLAILFTDASAFSSYNLASSIGPISGTPVGNPLYHFPTTGGSLILNDVSSVSFQAVDQSPGVTPEPSSFALLGTGILALAGTARRRLASA